MKLAYLLAGLLIGGGAMYFYRPGTSSTSLSEVPIEKSIKDSGEWKWPDSLDALIAAPEHHEILFQDSELRIMKVTVVPGVTDPVHTHKGRGVLWVTRTTPILYKTYDFGPDAKLRLTRTDTMTFKLDKGVYKKPEGPHSVEVLGKDTFQLYRVEYKN